MSRERRNYRKMNNFKKLIITSGVALVAAVIIFVVTYIIYSNKLKQNLNSSMLKAEQLADLIPKENADGLIEEANSQIGKTIDEVQANMPEIPTVEETPIPIITETPTPSQTPVAVVVEEKTPEFIRPVEGEIVRAFAKDSLVYSETLKEWITHFGIDIKADKTTVVKAASDGVVSAIKNDPRYGLTVIIEHSKGFKTVYSNLLTAEFVSVGEQVVSGQTVGTIGNTANFEIADDYHLHFEILENDVNLDPSLYIK